MFCSWSRSSVLPRWSCCGLLPALLLATGCPGDDGSSAETTSSSASGSSTIAATDDTAGSVGTAGTADSGDTADSGGTSTSTTDTPMCISDPTPPGGEALVQITVELLNDTMEPAYVLGSFQECDGLRVSRNGDVVPLTHGFACGCECPGPPSIQYESVALEPGMTHATTWDGRTLATYQRREDCGDGFCASDTVGVPVPLEEGPVTLRIPMYMEAGTFESPQSGIAFLEMCPADWSFEVDIELGTEDQVVEVLLSDISA